MAMIKDTTERLILVTNDDGFDAPGLHALIQIASQFGHVIAVAPVDPQSGMSHAITFKYPLRLNRVKQENHITLYKVTGTPADCVKLALNKILPRKPDLILSGINHGSNTAASVFYSGTMAGAIEGALNDVPAAGFSLLNTSVDADFSVAVPYVSHLIEKMIVSSFPSGTCLNVNIPAIPQKDIKGVKLCRMTKGVWEEEFEQRKDPHNFDYFWLTGKFNNFEQQAVDTDEWATRHGYVAVVPIQIDLTNFPVLRQLKSWEINDV